MDTKEIPIETVNLPSGILKEEITVCTVQLKSPFPDEINPIKVGTQTYFGWRRREKGDKQISRRERIANLLTDLSARNKIERRVDILIFPEYSLEKESLEDLEKYAVNNRSIAIGGYYDDDQRRSVAAIFVPSDNGVQRYNQPRFTVSRLDADCISHDIDPKASFLRFLWTPEGNKKKERIEHFLQIFVCLDFISLGIFKIDMSMPGLVVVPMLSPIIDEFFGISSALIRSIEGFRSIAVALCNSVDISGSKESFACGKTQVVGPSTNPFYSLRQLKEGGIVSTLKLGNALTIPTRTSSSPYVISSQIKFSIDSQGMIEEQAIVEDYYLFVNPNALISILGLHKIYSLFCTDNYYNFRSFVQNRYFPIKSNGIYGTFDILMQGYEETWDFFDQRLTYYLEEQYTALKRQRTPEHFEITHVVKFRGIKLMEISEQEFTSIFDYKGLHDYIADHLRELRDIMNRKIISEELKQELIARNVIFKADCDSDITPEEKEEGNEEYLVFVFLRPYNIHIDEKTLVQVFHNRILKPLINDNRVRTIEFCMEGGAEGAKRFTGSYILHIVGKLDDLKDIIIKRIHKPLYENGVQCGTRVIPTAESISTELFEPLSETIIGQKNRPTVLKIIKSLVGQSDPFIIKKLTSNDIEGIASFHNNYENYINGVTQPTDKSSMDLKKQYESNMYNFIYCISNYLISEENLTPTNYDYLTAYCSPVFSHLATKIEQILKDDVEKIKKVVYDESFNTLKYLDKLTNRGIDLEKGTSILGDLIDTIIKWNTKIAKDSHIIGDKPYTGDVLRLNEFVNYRNKYIHAPDSEKAQKITAATFANESLIAASVAIKFISKYDPKLKAST